MQVSNHLCDEHSSYWLTHAFQPPKPNYDEPEKGAVEKARMGIQMAKQMEQTVIGLQMVTWNDAQDMLKELEAAKRIADGIPQSAEEATHHLRTELARLEKAFIEVQQAYQHLAQTCEERIREYERRTGMEILGEREAPAQSGIPAPRESLAPPVQAGVRRVK